MHNLYITYNDGEIRFYAYRYIEKVTYEKLTEEEVYAELSEMNRLPIKRVSETEKSLTVTLENNQNIEIDTLEIFKQDSKYSSLLIDFMKKTVSYLEQNNIEELKDKLPQGHTPKVNRHKSKNIGKRIVAAGLVGAFLLSSVGTIIYMNSQKKQKDKNKSQSPASIEMLADNYRINPKNIIEIPIAELKAQLNDEIERIAELSDNVVELSYERMEDGKLQSTIDYCGDIIEYYCTRYGLPYDTVCSQITQERPNITPDGSLKNPCQLTNFVGNSLTVPVYDENGLTGEYDSYTVTRDMVDSLDWNIKIGIGYLRLCTNKYDSLITGTFAYNQGINALSNACNYYSLDLNDYKGDENAIKARDLVVQYYKQLQEEGKTKGTHGDPNYLENVFRYESSEDRDGKQFEYFVGNDLKIIAIRNALEYNNDLGGR